MKFHVLTLFPEMIENGLHTSITGRAIEKGILSVISREISMARWTITRMAAGQAW